MATRGKQASRLETGARKSRSKPGAKPRAVSSASGSAPNVRVPEEFSVREWSAFLLLVGLSFVSALGVVHATHESRMLVNELQELENQRNQLQVEWGQLLLEESSLVSQGRIETRARTELGMKVPRLENVIVVRRDWQ